MFIYNELNPEQKQNWTEPDPTGLIALYPFRIFVSRVMKVEEDVVAAK